MINDFNQFRKDIIKVSLKRNHKASSIKNRDIIKKIKRENKNIKCDIITYCKLIRRINQLLSEELLNTGKIIFPYKLGSLIIEVKKTYIKYIDNKLKRTTVVNWNKTLQLWYNDKEAKEKKILIRNKEENVYAIKYIRVKNGYKNQHKYKFFSCRSLKLKLKERIQNKGVFSYEHRIYNNTTNC